jgi:hypothetical protein
MGEQVSTYHLIKVFAICMLAGLFLLTASSMAYTPQCDPEECVLGCWQKHYLKFVASAVLLIATVVVCLL